MNTRRSLVVVGMLLQAAGVAFAQGVDRQAWLVVERYPLARAVVTNNCIVVQATGRIAVSWRAAGDLLARPRLLDDVQRAYVATPKATKAWKNPWCGSSAWLGLGQIMIEFSGAFRADSMRGFGGKLPAEKIPNRNPFVLIPNFVAPSTYLQEFLYIV